ncbi:uncharacterized protein LOC142352168 isoform X2 [Convolutriloba macropyga]|uniref:uncharacterized protein LOC142352168 isoform X2 n=1 Tax=Convolutriloba macropyga TaxID=536237 RepID=UPI003F51F96B
MPPKSVSTGRNPTKQMSTPIVQPATSSRSKSNQNRLEKQDSIHESSKLLNKKSKTEKSLEVPVTTTRRYSLPTAQIIEEAKENAYLKKTQQQRQGGSGGGGSESRRGSQGYINRQQVNASRRGSRVDVANSSRRSSKTELNGSASAGGATLMVPGVGGNARRLSSPNLAPSAGSSRRGSFVATLGLGDAGGSQSLGSRRNSAMGLALSSGSTGLLGGLSALTAASTSAQTLPSSAKKSEPILGFLPSVSIGGDPKGGGGKKTSSSQGTLSSWLAGGNKNQSNSRQNSQSGGLGGAGSNLTYRSRLQAFAICLVAGILIETLGCTGMFMEVNKRTVLLFLIFTSVGNFAIITSTTFLASLAIQRRQLTEETRLFSGLVYVVMLLVSCAVALVLKNPVLVALAIFAKDFSIIWYSLTYIPLARAAMRQCLAA